EALAALGPKPAGASAIYLRALCFRASGSLLKAAAAFQDVADRYPESKLRDYALLAKADAFLKAKDYRSAAEEFARAAERVLDALGRRADATGTYQAVVSGYPLEPESPAAAYLAGVGLLSQNRPLAAAPYFQIVLDRYASRADSSSTLTFASPELAGLVDAALCLLEYSYH